MADWTETVDGWRLDLGGADGGGPSLPRLEIRQGKRAWVVCVLGSRSGRACTGTAFSLEEARRAALAEAQAFLDQEHEPLLGELLAEQGAAGRTPPLTDPDARC